MSEFKKIKMNYDEVLKLYGGYWRYNILDFRYLYNHYFPTKNLVKLLQKKLAQVVDNYPSTHRIIAKLLAKWKDADYFNESNLVVGNGSSELIRVLNQIMDKVTVPIPTFNEYVQLPKEKMNLFITNENAKFKLDIDKLINSINKSKSSFVVINNPNNPIGNVLTREEIQKLLNTGVMTIVDEAFIDFCPEHSVEDLIVSYENLIVIKSCSKTMGFPGLRLGYMLTANDEIKDKVKRLLPIWNINSLSEVFIEIFPEFKRDYQKSLKKTLVDRNYLFKLLKKLTFLEPYETYTNFIFCRTSISSRKIAEKLFDEHKILIKCGLNQETLKSDKYIRIGVKTKEENNKLIFALKQLF